jgi:drug/metabolite transporter (DMT)-like permease
MDRPRPRHPSPRAQVAGGDGLSAAGMGAGVTAGLVWGLAFLLPVLLGGWNPVIVTAGRYLAYGLLSAFLFALGGRSLRHAAREHWRMALAFAVAGNVGYYLLLVVGIRAAGAPLTDMVIGAIPVVLAVAGNWLWPAYRWRRLALPLTLVTLGLALVSALEISGVHAYLPGPTSEKVAGLTAACGAVLLWTWYALTNARYLVRHHALPPALWSTVVGLATGAVTVAGLPLAAVTGQLTAPATGNPGTGKLIAAIVILGVVVSWAGTWLWNLASGRLSPTLAGLLVNVETVAGFAYVYAAKAQWPPAGQLTGLILVITGVALTVRASGRGNSLPPNREPRSSTPARSGRRAEQHG